MKENESLGSWIEGIISLVDASLKIIKLDTAEVENGDFVDLYPLREVVETIRERLTSEQRYEFEKQLSNIK